MQFQVFCARGSILQLRLKILEDDRKHFQAGTDWSLEHGEAAVCLILCWQIGFMMWIAKDPKEVPAEDRMDHYRQCEQLLQQLRTQEYLCEFDELLQYEIRESEASFLCMLLESDFLEFVQLGGETAADARARIQKRLVEVYDEILAVCQKRGWNAEKYIIQLTRLKHLSDHSETERMFAELQNPGLSQIDEESKERIAVRHCVERIRFYALHSKVSDVCCANIIQAVRKCSDLSRKAIESNRGSSFSFVRSEIEEICRCEFFRSLDPPTQKLMSCLFLE